MMGIGFGFVLLVVLAKKNKSEAKTVPYHLKPKMVATFSPPSPALALVTFWPFFNFAHVTII